MQLLRPQHTIHFQTRSKSPFPFRLPSIGDRPKTIAAIRTAKHRPEFDGADQKWKSLFEIGRGPAHCKPPERFMAFAGDVFGSTAFYPEFCLRPGGQTQA